MKINKISELKDQSEDFSKTECKRIVASIDCTTDDGKKFTLMVPASIISTHYKATGNWDNEINVLNDEIEMANMDTSIINWVQLIDDKLIEKKMKEKFER